MLQSNQQLYFVHAELIHLKGKEIIQSVAIINSYYHSLYANKTIIHLWLQYMCVSLFAEQKRKEYTAKFPYIQLIPEVLPYLPMIRGTPSMAAADPSQVTQDKDLIQGEQMFCLVRVCDSYVFLHLFKILFSDSFFRARGTTVHQVFTYGSTRSSHTTWE